MLESMVPAGGEGCCLVMGEALHDRSPAVRGLIHYPVTTRFWRGVLRVHQVGGLGRHLRRACDWHVTPLWAVNGEPTCADCLTYRENLRRLGYLRW